MATNAIIVDTSSINRLTIELRGFEGQVEEATYHALNRAVDYTLTQVGRIVTKEYAIKQKDVKESFKTGIRKPTRTNLTASITSTGHVLSIAHFPHTPTTPIRGGASRSVKVQIKRSGGKKVVNTSPKPFIMSTGARDPDGVQFNVFRREGRGRMPVVVLKTLSIPQMITSSNTSDQIQAAAQAKIEERLQHEIIRSMTAANTRINRR